MPVHPALPAAVSGYAVRGPTWQRWVSALPGLRQDLMDEWGLDLDGDSMYGQCALVDPVHTGDGQPAVLKIGWPHWEADHEQLALRHWAGDGAVRLLRADPRRYALLLERADAGRDLNAVPDIEACEIVAALYDRLHVPATPALRLLSDQAARWSRQLRAMPVTAPLPRRLVEQAAALAADLAVDPTCDGRLVHTDLHYDNVLAATREPWLVIDPKPLSGDPHFEVAPLLWNRWDELVATGDVRTAIRTRFHTVVDAASLDESRGRDWVVVRELVNAMWTIAGDEPVRELDNHVTACVSVAKAVQD
ncbi:streptomycin 6-kinase [soil metagenome]